MKFTLESLVSDIRSDSFIGLEESDPLTLIDNYNSMEEARAKILSIETFCASVEATIDANEVSTEAEESKDGVGKKLKLLANKALQAIQTWVGKFTSNIQTLIGKVFGEGAVSGFNKIFGPISKGFSSVKDKLEAKLRETPATLQQFVKSLTPGKVVGVTSAVVAITGIVTKIKGSISGKSAGDIIGMLPSIKGAVDDLHASVKAGMDEDKSPIELVQEWVLLGIDKAKSTVDPLIKGISKFIKEAGGLISEITKGISSGDLTVGQALTKIRAAIAPSMTFAGGISGQMLNMIGKIPVVGNMVQELLGPDDNEEEGKEE